ncbi:MAG: hypothetical protein ACRC68_02925, partial [Clostridium sp.]
YYYVYAKERVGVVRGDITSEETSGCAFSYKGKKNERLELKYTTKIKNGTIKFQIIDSKDKSFVVFDNDDEYIIKAVYDDFKGNFKLTAYKDTSIQ